MEIIKKHVIYARKSKYTGKGESVDNQTELCKEKLKLKYPDIDLEKDVVYLTDEGFTGANTNRPAFQQMMDLIRDKKVLSVTCYRLDRISRNVGDFCELIKEFEKYHVGFLSIREDFDTNTPMGKAMMLMSSVFAQLERDTIAERIRDNMLELAKTGRWLGGTTPTGFKSVEIKNITVDGKTKKLFKLEEIPEEKEIVLLLVNKYKEIKSQTGLETYTIQNNISTKRNKKFTRWSLVNILSNPVYAAADEDSYNYFLNKGANVIGDIKDYDGKHGLMVYNKTNQTNNNNKKETPITEWIVAIGKHKPFYSGSEYIKIQDLLKLGADKRFRKSAVNNALLSGLLRCEHCGSFMRPKLSRNTDKNGNKKFKYLCELKDKSRKTKCNTPNLDGNEADKKVIEIIKELITENSDFYKAIKEIADGKIGKANDKNTEIVNISNMISKNEKSIATLVDRLKEVPSEIVSDIANEIAKLKKENKVLIRKKNELNEHESQYIDDSETAQIILNLFDNIYKNFDEMDLFERRTVARLIIRSAYSDGKNLTINLGGTRMSAKSLNIPTSDNCK